MLKLLDKWTYLHEMQWMPIWRKSDCSIWQLHILNSQTIAGTLIKHHETAKANRKQRWLRTTRLCFDMQLLRMRIESKHKHIQDTQEKKRIIFEEYEDFMKDYECFVYGRPSPDL
jgi:hypothetical protein